MKNPCLLYTPTDACPSPEHRWCMCNDMASIHPARSVFVASTSARLDRRPAERGLSHAAWAQEKTG
jgi:hypothetical protein